MNKLILDKKEIIDILGNEYLELASIFSDKFGIVNAVLERNELSKYDLYMYQCLSANTKDLFSLSREVSSGGLGVDESKYGALISCLAEALERYSMSFVPKKELTWAKLTDLPFKNRTSDFSTYNIEQYINHKEFLNPYKNEIHFTKIKKYINPKEYKYWPASLIYLPFENSKVVAETTSTGMAAGTSIDNCVKSGLLELIERDALMINFLNLLNPNEIDINTISGTNKSFLDKIKKTYHIKIYELFSDIKVPVYFSLIYKKVKGNIHYGIGASCNLDSDIAINKSLKECLFTNFYSKGIADLRKDNPNEINALYEHFLYYQGSMFNELLFNGSVVSYQRKTMTLNDIINNLMNCGIDVYYKELTTSDIKKTGIKVVKVIAPGLIDLNKSHILPRLGAKRLYTVPNKLGLQSNISKKPHPFP